MCRPGYFGQYCGNPCPSGSFGPECGGFCFPKCSNVSCHHVYGCLEKHGSTIQRTNSGIYIKRHSQKRGLIKYNIGYVQIILQVFPNKYISKLISKIESIICKMKLHFGRIFITGRQKAVGYMI